jgi:predicted pyridoxine 5'-phosphate oxidase superfamily flavin-nucleotide-binding protein
MSAGYASVALTGEVRAAEARLASAAAITRLTAGHPSGTEEDEPRDALTAAERQFVADRGGFYLASVSSTGWPYIQFRGGPPGFVHSPDEHTLAWADFRGNRQYISSGNLAAEERVSLFFVDYPDQLRLKVFGRAQVIEASKRPDTAAALSVIGYHAIVEQIFTVTVVAYDWNCQQHITPRYSKAELQELTGTTLP